VGLPLSVAFPEAGERVVAVDVDECKVALIAPAIAEAAAATTPYNRSPLRARSSAGERSLHTREVGGSKPPVPIRKA
jgi:UDP-N-acetyl-D-mannosaminuronate dehydrogenase